MTGTGVDTVWFHYSARGSGWELQHGLREKGSTQCVEPFSGGRGMRI